MQNAKFYLFYKLKSKRGLRHKKCSFYSLTTELLDDIFEVNITKGGR